ncbi:MAG: 2-succinyl-6-hydroxy-2,4-cyclohexadiene-1-carboxylate synthase [Thermoflavifilum sp.]|nr:2-succinyl-6-hydroxy-2,4-cyclohexadiene-1-carboxylate synthase [Thermoflavifilum sp.]MCL6514188.1 2-succinyl-6-hydroxy-2,4-cyclohexadiene-1-carboxylate synthase [Alicyclobacillus sp.]
MVVDGVRWYVDDPAGPLPPLLLLHGFTGSADSWADLRARWQGRWRCIAVDLPGHGRTYWPDDGTPHAQALSMPAAAAGLAKLMKRLGCSRYAVLGYSLGGRTALALACHDPQRVAALVLESASPGLRTPAERQARREQDEALADWLEEHGIPAFVERWQALPLFASQERLSVAVRDRQRAIRLAQSAQGLAQSLRGMGTGAQPPLWEVLPRLALPVLLVTGSLDAKFCAIAAEMAASLPAADHRVVAGAGHAVHLEVPETYAALVEEFLERCMHPSAGEIRGWS